MKTYFYSLIWLLLPCCAFAQGVAQDITTNDPMYQYAELLGTGKLFSNKVLVEIDFGQETKLFDFHDSNRIIDPETGKPKVFNSMVDAMNFMGALGWEFVQAYVVTVANQNVYHWLLKRPVTDKERSDILPMVRGDLKQQ